MASSEKGGEKTVRFLIGTETEFGLWASSPADVCPSAGELAPLIVETLAENCRHAPSPDHERIRRIFLENGACAYADFGGHPEVASAECADPTELAAQTIALREMLLEAAERVSQVYGIPIRLVANNIDYAAGGARTYGHHVNVLMSGLSLATAARELAPLLAALPLLAGTGRVSFSMEARGFELSQRASHMTALFSGRTLESRALFTQKGEPLCDHGVRLHVIGIDTPMTCWQQLLVPAIVALAVKALELGYRPTTTLALADPLKALHAVSCDPDLCAPLALAGGGEFTALDLLERYRTGIEAALCTQPAASMPAWTGTALALWQQMLDNLRSDPALESERIFWVGKLLFFTQILRELACSWSEFARWSYVLSSLRRLQATSSLRLHPLEIDTAQRAERALDRSSHGILEAYRRSHDLDWIDLPRIWQVATRLCLACIERHTLGAPAAWLGHAAGSPIGDEAVQRARTQPPRGTRATVRARAIREAAVDARAGWNFVITDKGRLAMDDAFGERFAWAPAAPAAGRNKG